MSIDQATPAEWDEQRRKRFHDNRDPKEVPYAPPPDPVNQPSHYTHGGGIECIDAIDAMLGREGSMYAYEANILKYLWRWRYKGGVESLRKCRWYLDRLIKTEVSQ